MSESPPPVAVVIGAGLQMRNPSRLPTYVDAVFHATWVEGRNLDEPAVAGEVLRDAEFDPQEFIALASDPQVKEPLKADSQQAVARGVFGAPTFFVGQQLFRGQERLDFVKEALQ